VEEAIHLTIFFQQILSPNFRSGWKRPGVDLSFPTHSSSAAADDEWMGHGKGRAGLIEPGLEIEIFFSGLPHFALATGTLKRRRDIQDNAKGTRGNKSENFDGWHDLNSPN
jgi:hypothetical protein